MRISLLTPEYPPSASLGGIATHTYTMARALTRAGHEVQVVTIGPPGWCAKMVLWSRVWTRAHAYTSYLAKRIRFRAMPRSTVDAWLNGGLIAADILQPVKTGFGKAHI